MITSAASGRHSGSNLAIVSSVSIVCLSVETDCCKCRVWALCDVRHCFFSRVFC